MQDTMVRVSPSGAGWVVDSDVSLQPLLFLSGGKAEAQAHALARSMASAGASVSVAVHDRDHRLIGGRSYSPARRAAPPPRSPPPEDGGHR